MFRLEFLYLLEFLFFYSISGIFLLEHVRNENLLGVFRESFASYLGFHVFVVVYYLFLCLVALIMFFFHRLLFGRLYGEVPLRYSEKGMRFLSFFVSFMLFLFLLQSFLVGYLLVSYLGSLKEVFFRLPGALVLFLLGLPFVVFLGFTFVDTVRLLRAEDGA